MASALPSGSEERINSSQHRNLRYTFAIAMQNPETLAQAFVIDRLKQLFSELAQQLGTIPDHVEQALNDKLKNAKTGESLGPLVVLDHQSKLITVQIRGTYPLLGQSAFVRARFRFEDHISLSKNPVFSGFELRSFMAEITVKKANLYECALGYGYDLEPKPYSVGRGMIDLVGPSIRLDVFLGGLSDDGFALALSLGASGDDKVNKFPVIIPLGATGLGITGIGGSFAHNFEPILDVNGPNAAHPTAHDYIGWARRADANELDVWRPASASGPYRGGAGINCDLASLDGFLIRLRKVGFAYLSFGPVIMFGGSGILLQSDVCKVDAMAALDFASGSIDVGAGASIAIPPGGSFKVLTAAGAMELFLSTAAPGLSYYNLGTDKSPIHGEFLTNIAQAAVYFMLNTRRVTTGGHLRFQLDLKLGPFQISLFFGLGGSALLGWNPVQIAASMDVSGGLKACAFGLCLGIELGGRIDISVPNPVVFALSVSLTLDLPWPLPNITWSGKIFDRSTHTDPELHSPLLLTAAMAPAISFGAVHARTGRQWKLDDVSHAHIWPDSDLVLPFSRKVNDRTGIVMGNKDESIYEGGFLMTHTLQSLRIIFIPDHGPETDVANLRAFWMAGPDGDISRLHVPCEDPFAWLFPYPTTEASSSVSPPATVEQNFGGGVAEIGVTAKRAFGNVSVTPSPAIDLVYLPTVEKSTRFLASTDFQLRLERAAMVTPVMVSEIAFTVATSDKTAYQVLVVPPGFVASPLIQIRKLGGDLWLSSFTIRRSDGAAFSALRLSSSVSQTCEGAGEGEGNRRCYQKLVLYSVRFTEKPVQEVTWQNRTILKPGTYRLEVSGETSTPGHPTLKWPIYRSKTFKVVYPQQLRPYVAYSTLGDSRIFGDRSIFGVGPKLWNPTPFGRGFPTYTDDKGVVRFNTPYVSSIFSKQLTFEVIGADHGVTQLPNVKLQENKEKVSSLSKKSQQWRTEHNVTLSYDEEIYIAPPKWVSGVGHVRTIFADDSSGTPINVLLDEWNFDISAFRSFAEHVKWKTESMIRLYLADGPHEIPASSWPATAPPALPAVTPSAPPYDWALPKALAALVTEAFEGDQVPTTSLRFLQFAQRLGTRFDVGNAHPLVGLIEPADRTVIEAAADRFQRPYALILRTQEPLDWRRVTVKVVFHPIAVSAGTVTFVQTNPISLAVRIVPNFDGTQAFLVAYVDEVAVRWPKAAYEISFTYQRQRDDLPTVVTRLGDFGDVLLTQRILYTSGQDWPMP